MRVVTSIGLYYGDFDTNLCTWFWTESRRFAGRCIWPWQGIRRAPWACKKRCNRLRIHGTWAPPGHHENILTNLDYLLNHVTSNSKNRRRRKKKTKKWRTKNSRSSIDHDEVIRSTNLRWSVDRHGERPRRVARADVETRLLTCGTATEPLNKPRNLRLSTPSQYSIMRKSFVKKKKTGPGTWSLPLLTSVRPTPDALTERESGASLPMRSLYGLPGTCTPFRRTYYDQPE